MSKFVKYFGATLFTVSALCFGTVNAEINHSLDIEDPSLFGIFCCCDWCGTCCDDNTCDRC